MSSYIDLRNEINKYIDLEIGNKEKTYFEKVRDNNEDEYDKCINTNGYDLSYLHTKLDNIKLVSSTIEIFETFKNNTLDNDVSFFVNIMGNNCSYCGSSLCGRHYKDYSGSRKCINIDHVLPKSKFNRFALHYQNLVVLCKECNNKKSTSYITKDGENGFIHVRYHEYFTLLKKYLLFDTHRRTFKIENDKTQLSTILKNTFDTCIEIEDRNTNTVCRIIEYIEKMAKENPELNFKEQLIIELNKVENQELSVENIFKIIAYKTILDEPIKML